ncbi:20502_t:CDS:1 [Funneliformis geosporum]|uniref:421_t:CDS:1 n=1 Tax=Funneliformis geosporum TaxID=1117311 RepID=A0A9W4WMD3_9GLOM|nr:20502_t:CDS:1 [Funneliformis geosporum]CAI2172742.1 421_t:CDS:1 [Funneliformis geosporum]
MYLPQEPTNIFFQFPPSPISSESTFQTINNHSENFQVLVDDDIVKNLLNMIPPPITVQEFVESNSFAATDGHIKRPSNSFMIFRKIAHGQKNKIPALTRYNQREFSRIIARIWNNLNNEELNIYKELSKEIVAIHRIKFPDYKYKPKRNKTVWKHFVYPVEKKNKRKVGVKKSKNNITTNYPHTPPELESTNISDQYFWLNSIE